MKHIPYKSLISQRKELLLIFFMIFLFLPQNFEFILPSIEMVLSSIEMVLPSLKTKTYYKIVGPIWSVIVSVSAKGLPIAVSPSQIHYA